MKFGSAAILLLAVLAFGSTPRAQEEEPIRETVAVVNVEVPVRVFVDGRSIAGLAKDEFEILEDGKVQPINGFYSFHKQIHAAPGEPVAATADRKPMGRYFVLIFRTYECNEALAHGVDYLFDSVFRPDDQVLVLANNRTMMFERLAADAEARGKIMELLRAESLAARNQMLGYVRGIEQNLNMNKFRMALGGRAELAPDYLTNFLDNYLSAWKEFKRRYLALELDKFYYFSRHLENVRKEKWVLNFYQLEQFPQIAFGGEIDRQLRSYIDRLGSSENPTTKAQGRNIERLLQSIEREMKVAEDFPAAEASKLFYKVNATFHSFFMRVFLGGDDSEMVFRGVATDIENSLRALTEATGGTLAASNDVAASLAVVREKADDYYVLTYEPADAKKIGRIKVRARDRKYKVLYDDNIRADYIAAYLKKKEAENPAVKVTELAFRDRTLSFSHQRLFPGQDRGRAGRHAGRPHPRADRRRRQRVRPGQEIKGRQEDAGALPVLPLPGRRQIRHHRRRPGPGQRPQLHRGHPATGQVKLGREHSESARSSCSGVAPDVVRCRNSS